MNFGYVFGVDVYEFLLVFYLKRISFRLPLKIREAAAKIGGGRGE